MRVTMLGSGSYKSSLSLRLIQFADGFARHDWHVRVILPSADKYNNFITDKKARLPRATLIQPWQFTTRKPTLNLLPYLFSATIAVFRSQPNIIYLYKPTPITVIGVLPKLLVRTKLVVDIDDLGSEVMRRQKQSPLAVALVAMSENIALRYADKIIVTSTYLASLMRHRYADKPIIVVPNGVTPGEYHKYDDTAVRPHIYYFGAIGTLDLVSDLLYALRDVHVKMPEVTASIIGDGSALKAAQQLADELELTATVTFTGYVDMLSVQENVEFGDIAICYQPDIPTVKAASNMKVFQYMAMSSAVVVSDVGDLGEYVKHGDAGVVVKPGNSSALASALVSLVDDADRRKSLAQAGRVLAEEEYSWDARTTTVQAFLSGERG